MPNARTCQACGSELPRHSPEGLCPGCLLLAGLDVPVSGLSGSVNAPIELGRSRVLVTLAATIGPVPRVLLRDTDVGPEPPVLRPSDRAADPSVRYRIDGEIARGGMGEVLKGRDPDLGRDVAVKVLRHDLRDQPEMIRRFVEEAQIGGQLQHPGIVPVYEMGTFADRRPYFSMKLVKGQTLAALLANRSSPADGLARFLGILEQVTQTVAYAHARGVIHRDLKPSNVMVGSFGEVQVMDWGLAKVLPHGGVNDDRRAGRVTDEETLIATARSGDPDAERSRAGSVMGTPSYMAPEQARGEIEDVDERSDVFALGSILCEVLTEKPAFTGRTSAEIQRKAARGDLADALARLDACEADGDLVDLARACLAALADQRPPDAGVVAGRLGTYLASVQERLRAAELARAAESARAEEALRTAEASEARARAERGARRTTAALAASVVAFVALGVGGAAWAQRQRALRSAATNRVVNEALAETMRLRGVAQSAGSDPARWEAALREARRASDLLGQDGEDSSLRLRVESALAFLRNARDEASASAERARVDRQLLADLAAARQNGSALNYQTFDDGYARAFRTAGIDVDLHSSKEVGAWVAARSVPTEIVSYLDDWAISRGHVGPKDGRRLFGHLIEAARYADPDPWRNTLRTGGLGDNAALRALADDTAGLERRSVVDLNLLILYLKGDSDWSRADRVRDLTWRLYPNDYWATVEMVHRHGSMSPVSPEQERHWNEDKLRYLSVLQSMKPSFSQFLYIGDTLSSLGRPEEAMGAYREANRRDPNNLEVLERMHTLSPNVGERDETLALLRRAAKPGAPAVAFFYLGNALTHQGRLDEAVEAHREAIRLDGDHLLESIFNLAFLYRDMGRYEEAAATFRRAKALAQAENRPDQVRRTEEQLPALEAKLALVARVPGFLAGTDRPNNQDELSELAFIFHHRGQNGVGTRFFEKALGQAPKLTGNPKDLDGYFDNLHKAACLATMAGCGESGDDPPPSASECARMRSLALGWLRDLVTLGREYAAHGTPEERAWSQKRLAYTVTDGDLAGVRVPVTLEKLSAPERDRWKALWADVESLLAGPGAK